MSITPRKYNPVRIRDIAEMFGVSTSTVSRALNPKTASLISAELVAQIREAAERLGYVSDAYASGLRTGQTNTVGVIIPDILNPIFPPIVKGIQSRLYEAGVVTLIAYSDNQVEVAQREIERMLARRVEGLILASAFVDDPSVYYCQEQGVPLVLLNRSVRSASMMHQVLNDDALGIELAVQHLKSLGHQRLCHFAGPPNILQGVERLDAFLRCCARMGMIASYLECEQFTLESGAKAALQFLEGEHDSTGIIAGNDLIAVGATQTFKQHGKRVPEDYSMVGFNGMPFSDLFDPPLTTVAIPHGEMGGRAADIILQEIETTAQARQHVKLQPELMVRASTRAL
jgi:LacI family transcriptional regulator